MWVVSTQFRNELKKPVHSVSAKVEFLDTAFNPVRTVTAYSADSPDDVLIDGMVDVDTTRGTRRTLTMSLLNPNGIFTPDASIWAENADWDGYFYVNRLIRLYRGVRYEDGSAEYVPIGTFMVDKSETLVERGISTVVIAGSDLFKKFVKSQFGTPTTFTDGTTLNSVIATLAASAGVTQMNLDPLTERTNASKQLQRDITFEADETRGDALLKICTDHGIEVFFNPMGVLTTREFSNPWERPTVWEFDPEDDMTFFLRNVIDDDRLYNHAIVVGSGDAQDGGPIYKTELKDTDSASPTSISRIGDRVFRYESPLLASQEATDKAAYTIFYKHFQISQGVSLETVCNPALEGNDVVWVYEPTLAKVNSRFLIKTLTVPLVTSKQKLDMSRVLDVRPA